MNSPYLILDKIEYYETPTSDDNHSETKLLRSEESEIQDIAEETYEKGKEIFKITEESSSKKSKKIAEKIFRSDDESGSDEEIEVKSDENILTEKSHNKANSQSKKSELNPKIRKKFKSDVTKKNQGSKQRIRKDTPARNLRSSSEARHEVVKQIRQTRPRSGSKIRYTEISEESFSDISSESKSRDADWNYEIESLSVLESETGSDLKNDQRENAKQKSDSEVSSEIGSDSEKELFTKVSTISVASESSSEDENISVQNVKRAVFSGKFIPFKHKFNCVICNAKLKIRQKYVDHMHRFHPESKLFPCPYPQCEETFGTQVKLKYHLNKHWKYKCNFCKKGYSKKYLFISHIKEKH